jgi:uncharacterized membrane protein
VYQPYEGGGPARKWPYVLMGVAGSIVALIVVLLVLEFYGYLGGFPDGRPSSGTWFFAFFPLFALFWVVLFSLRLVFWSGYGRYPGRWHGEYGDPAIEAARHRYARGEITRDQYAQIMDDLGRGRARP